MTTLKHKALRLAALTALRDFVAAEIDTLRVTTRDDAVEARAEFGVKSLDVQLPDGSIVATVTLTDPQPRPFIYSERALLAYVRTNYPNEIVETVRDSFKKALLEQLAPMPDGTDGAVNTATGEVVEGVMFRTGAPAISLRFKTDGREAIAQSWQRGALQSTVPLMLEGGA